MALKQYDTDCFHSEDTIRKRTKGKLLGLSQTESESSNKQEEQNSQSQKIEFNASQHREQLNQGEDNLLNLPVEVLANQIGGASAIGNQTGEDQAVSKLQNGLDTDDVGANQRRHEELLQAAQREEEASKLAQL